LLITNGYFLEVTLKVHWLYFWLVW